MKNTNEGKRLVLLFASSAALLIAIALTCTWAIAGAAAATEATGSAELTLEDLPEFAPRFQPVVARRRVAQHVTMSQLGCALSGKTLCAHSVWR